MYLISQNPTVYDMYWIRVLGLSDNDLCTVTVVPSLSLSLSLYIYIKNDKKSCTCAIEVHHWCLLYSILLMHSSNCNCHIRRWLCRRFRHHSVESPSMVDPQWNIWYWGSKWNLHTVCWDAVGCEWGTTSVYLGITYVYFIPSRLPVFTVEPQYRHQDFFVKSIIWRTHTKSSKNFMLVCIGFVGQILIDLWTSSIWGFL